MRVCLSRPCLYLFVLAQMEEDKPGASANTYTQPRTQARTQEHLVTERRGELCKQLLLTEQVPTVMFAHVRGCKN